MRQIRQIRQNPIHSYIRARTKGSSIFFERESLLSRESHFAYSNRLRTRDDNATIYAYACANITSVLYFYGSFRCRDALPSYRTVPPSVSFVYFRSHMRSENGISIALHVQLSSSKYNSYLHVRRTRSYRHWKRVRHRPYRQIILVTMTIAAKAANLSRTSGTGIGW
jgi:hypothetical protein